MKKLFITALTTVFFGCFLGKAQTTLSNTNVSQPAAIATTPVNISQFEVRGRLITQNSFLGTTTPPAAQQTGSFDPTARWNSMGNIDFNAVTPNLTQTINGVRTQTNARGLAWGHSIPAPGQPNAGIVSNSFIEWIGNNLAPNTFPNNITPGNLEFRYALSPTAAAAGRITSFVMAQGLIKFGNAVIANTSNSYAQNGLLGHFENTSTTTTPSKFGEFGIDDKWIGIGNPPVSGNPLYGMRTYWKGFSINNAIREDAGQKNAIIEWGGDVGAITGLTSSEMKFRFFSSNTTPSAVIQNLGLRANGTSYFGTAPSTAFSNPFAEVNAGQTFNQGLAVYTNPGTSTVAPSGIKVNAISGSNTNTMYGINALAQDAGTNYGIYARAESSQDNYGIYAEVIGGNNNIAGYFSGAVVSTTGFYTVSDKLFKKNIETEASVLNKINKLNVVTYLMDQDKFPTLNFSDKINHGFIAQELEEVFPELVKNVMHPIFKKGEMVEKVELKTVNYTELVPLLTKAIQELNTKVETLNNQLQAATSSTLVVNDDKNSLPTEIQNKAFALSQNVPNPFSENTTISYTIPATAGKAILAVFDLNGKMLLQYNLQQGKNTIVVKGNTLGAGMYLYSLIADGQEVLSKRMVLTK
jgi:hypothetical protein